MELQVDPKDVAAWYDLAGNVCAEAHDPESNTTWQVVAWKGGTVRCSWKVPQGTWSLLEEFIRPERFGTFATPHQMRAWVARFLNNEPI